MKVFSIYIFFSFINVCQAGLNIIKIDSYFEVEDNIMVAVATLTDTVEVNNENLFDNKNNARIVVKKDIYNSVAHQLIYQQGRNRFVYHREYEDEPYHLYRRYTLSYKSPDLLIGHTKLSRELDLDEVNEIGVLIDKALFDIQ